MERYNFKEDTLLQNRLLTKTATLEELDAHETWISESAQNRHFWEDLDSLFLNEEAVLVASQVDTEASWSKIEKRILTETKSTSYSSYFKTHSTITRLAIAASFVGVILSAIIYISLYNGVSNNLLATNIDIKEVQLEDGSTVTINSHSQFNYPTAFNGDSREVNLTGEAFFEITKNPEKPFIVNTNNLQIKVLGTKFNVDDFGNSSQLMQVSVQEGKVEVKSKSNPNQVIILIKGESAVLDKLHGTFFKSTSSSFNNAGWKTKIFNFNNNNLNDVFNTLSKAYKMDIEVKDTTLYSQHLTASFEKKDINFVMTIISTTFNLNYTIENEKIIVNSTTSK